MSHSWNYRHQYYTMFGCKAGKPAGWPFRQASSMPCSASRDAEYLFTDDDWEWVTRMAGQPWSSD